MDIINLIAKSSLSVIMIKPNTVEPTGFGSGCIANYKDVLYFLTVAHVADFDGEQACIATYNMHDKGQDLFCMGAMWYFDLYKIPKNLQPDKVSTLEQLLHCFDEKLDIAFCRVPLPMTQPLLQPEWNFGFCKIDKGEKAFLNLEYSTVPVKGKLYGFSGQINQSVSGNVIKGEPTLKLDLEYINTVKYYHVFKAMQVIKRKEEYEGCSGAPILDEDGRLVGLATSVKVGTPWVYAFSIERCKQLLEIDRLNSDVAK